MSTSARSATETASAYPVRVERDVPAAMRDGTVLRADIYRPAALGPFPVLLCRTPYDKLRNHTVDIAERAAARGYIDTIVYPEETRAVIAMALRTSLQNEGPHIGPFVLPPIPGAQP